ncbi:MAG: hypothetical protein FWC23_04290 [Chitinispirillia bacterium]|nr:hypothetical protein [Chitinispirillia bacterium]MCL2268386.1 hypothetical protein [Chitinispirillia bacterium]
MDDSLILRLRRAVPVIFMCLAMAAAAPAIEYRVLLNGVLDNYEYGPGFPVLFSDVSLNGVQDDYEYSQGLPAWFHDRTVFFVRVQPELGLEVEGSHKIFGGFSYLQEFGAEALSENLHLLLYYHYDDERLQFRFGAFPRAGATDVPEWLFGREAAYYRPFVHGAAVEVQDGTASAGAWVDWTGRRAVNVNESFLFGTKLGYGREPFFARHDFMMYHYAHKLLPDSGANVQDHGGMSAEAGAAWGQTASFDTLTASAGVIIALERDRGGGVWHTPAGGFVRGFAAARMLAVRGFIYAGEPLRMLWGSDFAGRWRVPNDNYAFTQTYGRLDLIGRFAVKENVRAELALAFHTHYISNGYWSPVGYSQHFLLHAEFGGPKKEEKKKKKGFSINFRWD